MSQDEIRATGGLGGAHSKHLTVHRTGMQVTRALLLMLLRLLSLKTADAKGYAERTVRCHRRA